MWIEDAQEHSPGPRGLPDQWGMFERAKQDFLLRIEDRRYEGELVMTPEEWTYHKGE